MSVEELEAEERPRSVVAAQHLRRTRQDALEHAPREQLAHDGLNSQDGALRDSSGNATSMPGFFPLARGSAWAGGRVHTPSRVPQRWGAMPPAVERQLHFLTCVPTQPSPTASPFRARATALPPPRDASRCSSSRARVGTYTPAYDSPTKYLG
jgi:hypothetical protein